MTFSINKQKLDKQIEKLGIELDLMKQTKTSGFLYLQKMAEHNALMHISNSLVKNND